MSGIYLQLAASQCKQYLLNKFNEATVIPYQISNRIKESALNKINEIKSFSSKVSNKATESLLDNVNKAKTIPSTISNTINEFQKKNQLLSMTINTVRNTAPLSAYLVTNYLSTPKAIIPTLPPMGMPAAPIPPFPASINPTPSPVDNSFLNSLLTGASTLAQGSANYLIPLACAYGTYRLANNYFYKDEHESIDSIISSLDSFRTRRDIPRGEPERASFKELLSKDLTFFDFKHLLEDVLYNKTNTLFGWHNITGDHRKPFEKCLELINYNINFLDDATDTVDASGQLRPAIDAVIAKMIELKATRSGIFTNSYKHPDTHPRLKELSERLLSFNNALSNSSRSNLSNTTDQLINTLQECLAVDSIFTKITSTHEVQLITTDNKNYFTTLEQDLKNLRDLPTNSPAFKEKQKEIKIILDKCYRLISTNPLPTHTLALKTQISPSKTKETSLFKTLKRIVKSNFENANEKRDSILQIIKAIDLTYEIQFENAFLDHIGKNQPAPPKKKRGQKASTPLATREWAKQNLISSNIDLSAAYKEVMKDLAQKAGFQNTDNSIKNYIKHLSEQL